MRYCLQWLVPAFFIPFFDRLLLTFGFYTSLLLTISQIGSFEVRLVKLVGY